MADSDFHAAPPTSSDINTIYQICRRCKKLLPIDHFMKNGVALKGCIDCRNAYQMKKRSGRSKLAEINAQLRQNPMLNRMIVENSIREACSPMDLPSNPRDISTTTLSNIIEPDRPFISTLVSNTVVPDTQKKMSPIHGKSAILAAAESMRKALDTFVALVKKGSCAASRQPSVNSSSHNIVESIEKSIKSESLRSQFEPSDVAGSDISGPSHFVCMHCGKPRSIGLRYDDICVYCFEKKQQFCVPGDHETDQNEFYDEDGNEYDACIDCREEMVKMEEMEIEIDIQIE
ncbi:unnamed protein product [Penicillium pancosmium]